MRFSLWSALFSPRALSMACWGALGGCAGYLLGELLGQSFGLDSEHARGVADLIFATALWTALIGVGIGSTILVGDNLLSLRGRWQRDLVPGALLFLVLGAVSGALAQMFYSPAMRWAGVGQNIDPMNPGSIIGLLVAGSLVRGVAWAVLGAGLGIGIGLLRRDWKAALRGALGGVVGGYHGGAVFNFVGLIFSAGGGSASRFVGLVLTGAAIAWCMRVAQEALRSAWLLGVSTGPYEGKECPLNKERVSVGRSESNDIALYRDETVPADLGQFVFQNGGWWWEGAPVTVDGVTQTKALLRPESIIQLGTYQFKFFDRARHSLSTPVVSGGMVPASPLASVAPTMGADVGVPTQTPTPAPAPPPIPVTNPYATTAPTVPPARAVAPVSPTAPPISPVPASTPRPVAPVPPQVVSVSGSLLVLTPLDVIHRPFSLAATARATVGRASTNDWPLLDAAVSGQHALLTIEGDVLVLRDLDSTNGTFVNGQKLAPNVPTALKEGDRVRFGSVECFVGRR